MKEITDQDWNLRLETDSAPQNNTKQSESENIVNKEVTYRDRELEIAKIPLVSRAIERMGARLLKVEDGFAAGDEPAERNESTD